MTILIAPEFISSRYGSHHLMRFIWNVWKGYGKLIIQGEKYIKLLKKVTVCTVLRIVDEGLKWLSMSWLSCVVLHHCALHKSNWEKNWKADYIDVQNFSIGLPEQLYVIFLLHESIACIVLLLKKLWLAAIMMCVYVVWLGNGENILE